MNLVKKIQKTLIASAFLSLYVHASAQAEEVAIVYAGKLLAIPGESFLEEKTVIIKDGIIDSVIDGYASPKKLKIKKQDSVTIVDLKDKFVLPGLIDTHVHMTDELGPRTKLGIVERSDADTAMVGAHHARITLQSGFTTVRDLNGRGLDAVFALKKAINKNYIPGPRMYVAGHIISPTGGHGQRSGYSDQVFGVLQTTGVCDGVAKCRQVVREQIRRGADQIKLVATGGVLTDSDSGTGQQFFDDELRAIVETSHALGRKVTAHAHDASGINAALRAGVDSIEHGTFANEESYELFRENGAYLVPTILAGATVTEMANSEKPFFAPSIIKKALEIGPYLIETTRKAHEAGVEIVFGTDSYVSKHGQNAREFELLVEAGLTSSEAIQAATTIAAKHMGIEDKVGSVEVGKYGDLIAVDSDPIEDVSQLLDIDFVMKDGVVYKHSE